MRVETNGRELSVLLDQYNHEIDKLKSKLLCGVPWEELVSTRKKITELAIAIHNAHDDKITQYVAEKPQNEIVAAE